MLKEESPGYSGARIPSNGRPPSRRGNSATENKLPWATKVKVKRWGKSPPALQATAGLVNPIRSKKSMVKAPQWRSSLDTAWRLAV